ncbi:methylated-DNA--[protein]-cysteine S-methyltransferase [Gulosibacter molinativorax]|uniref:Methylated-DNA--[protein]-cysteine S-methyltransferase n=1 Tax=Gulosibacter molinativorax TaxID=256821 RepID=A0ABT7C7S7_9MICO|nr:methylated-DNA--[protein]-cysteine S-methyltransferase [Gulosibacter molinativorax]MDJ1371244.1 methylated-DNA--[protein]-cysteine S-methyltransferase [Gulosibacter molinativorax]QUY63060.1 Bifunctional transcriptional activator/DNA repair enzyme Ada [Gulosibacter molinativorax]
MFQRRQETEQESATVETIDTPDGPFTLIEDAQGRVLASGWTGDALEVLERIHRTLRPFELVEGETQAAKAVVGYYAGDMQPAMEVPVRQHGTALQQRGWRELRRIPPGEPLNYTEFARRLGSPNAVRAAASVCAKNSPALFVPCHRVLRSDGSLGGFAWGTDVKQSLLDRERTARDSSLHRDRPVAADSLHDER